MASRLALAARCRHEGISFVDQSLDRAKRFRLAGQEADGESDSQGGGGFLRGCWLPVALQAALRRWCCSWATKNAPDECGIVFHGAVRQLAGYDEMERSCGVTLFADEVLEKNLLEVSTADNCERTVGKRMDAVNEALESCGLKQNAEKLVVSPNLRRTVENRRFSRSKTAAPDQRLLIASWASSHALSGHRE